MGLYGDLGNVLTPEETFAMIEKVKLHNYSAVYNIAYYSITLQCYIFS